MQTPWQGVLLDLLDLDVGVDRARLVGGLGRVEAIELRRGERRAAVGRGPDVARRRRLIGRPAAAMPD